MGATRSRRTISYFICLLAFAAVAAGPGHVATGLPGSVRLLAGGSGCFSEATSSVPRVCRHTPGLAGSDEVVVALDGRFVYTTAADAGAVASFVRDAKTGRLTPLVGQSRCVADPFAGEACVPGIGLTGADALALGGGNLYVASTEAVTSFSRNARTGQLRQLGCVGEGFVQQPPDGCLAGKVLSSGAAVAVSPDGRNVYVGASAGVSVFDRTNRGALAQLADAPGCIADATTDEAMAGACEVGTNLQGIDGLAVSRDGRFMYAASATNDTVAVLARNPQTGALSQLPGPQGCVEDAQAHVTDQSQCAPANDLSSPGGLAFSPDGRYLYVAASGSDAIDVFARNPSSGTLVELPGAAGCASLDGPPCSSAREVGGASEVAISADGRTLYAAAGNDGALAVFARNIRAGTLRQLPGAAGCVGAPGCTAATTLDDASGVAISPDGVNLYATSRSLGVLSIFERTPTCSTPKACRQSR